MRGEYLGLVKSLLINIRGSTSQRERVGVSYICKKQSQYINAIFYFFKDYKLIQAKQFKMNANVIPKDVLIKQKMQLIKQYKQKQDRYRSQINSYTKQSQDINLKIVHQCQQLKVCTSKLKEKTKQFISNCVQSLDDDHKRKQIINLKDLTSYLKAQKQILAKLSEQKQNKPSRDLDLHKLLTKSKLQQTLRKIRKVQLEEEIKYLENNVISKDNLIYNAAASSSVPPSQQKQVNSRLQNLIIQLQRVITLSIPCVQHSNQSSKLDQLQMQTKRLKQCQDLVTFQHERLGRLMKYFQSECLSIPQNFAQLNSQNTIPSINVSKFSKWTQQRVLQQQLDDIISFSNPNKSLVGKLYHKFDDCEQKIQDIRRKYKKLQSLM